MTCSDCDCGGLVFVKEGYVDQLLPMPADFDDLAEKDQQSILGQRAGLRNSVYPCPTCRPGQFAAWSKGQYAIAPLGTRAQVPAVARRSGRMSKPDLPLEPPSDLDERDMTLPTRRDLE